MAKDLQPVAKSILENVGGASNVKALTHCMTRLRFVLNDETKADHEALKKIQGVMGVVKQDGGVQVIVGNNVAAFYAEIMKLGVTGGTTTAAAPANAVKQPLTLKKVGSNILDAIIGTMSPLIPAIIGGSMIKLVAMVLNLPQIGILASDSTTFILLNIIGDGPFFFLPIMVAVSASRKFGVNTFLAMAIAGALVHPTFVDLMAKAAEGKEVTLALIPVWSVKYTYTVIPAIVMTWILSYIERWVDSITPPITKNFLKPMLILIIAAPISIILVGPAGVWLGTAISGFVFWVHDILGWLSVAIMGAIWPLLVMTGMHRVFTPTIVQTIAQVGKEGTVMPSEIGANLSLGGASLAVALKTKNIELRQTAVAAAASAIVAGITEPALYGVAIRLKRPMIASCITGFVCGAIAGMGGLASHSMASPGLFTSVQFIDPANPGRSVAFIVAVMVVAVVLSFILTLLFGFKDIPNEGNEAAL
jgi:PTS system arbutin/cellobiose/salicin-specific IIC component